MEQLLGKTITKVELGGEEADQLIFTDTDGTEYCYNAYGDCCSVSWFSHISGLKNLLGNKIIEVENRQEFSKEEQKKAEKEGDYDSLQLYGILLKTDKGTCDIEFRNDSNGYYGGSVDFGGKRRASSEYKEITEDF